MREVALENVVEGGEPSLLAAKESVWSEVVRTSGIEGGTMYWVPKWSFLYRYRHSICISEG